MMQPTSPAPDAPPSPAASTTPSPPGRVKTAPRCQPCGRDVTSNEFRCLRCHSVVFCSRECQVTDFRAHKKACSELRTRVAQLPARPKPTTGAGGGGGGGGGDGAPQTYGEKMNALGIKYQYNSPVDNVKAVRCYVAATNADPPCVHAYHNLALCYKSGIGGLPKDPAKAVDAWERGSLAGSVQSQVQLGQCLLKGTGVEADPSGGYRWLKLAADTGDPGAQVLVAYCYLTGYGVALDSAKGFEYTKRSALQGNADAMRNLSECYRHGDGCVKSDSERVHWLQRAKFAGHITAARELDEFAASQTTPEARAAFAAITSRMVPLVPVPERTSGGAGEVGGGLPTPTAVRAMGTGELRRLLAKLGVAEAGETRKAALIDLAQRALPGGGGGGEG